MKGKAAVHSMADIRARYRAVPSASVVNDATQFHVKPDIADFAATPRPSGWSSTELKIIHELCFQQGRNTDEVGALLGRSGNAVRMKLSRKGWVAPYKRRSACR